MSKNQNPDNASSKVMQEVIALFIDGIKSRFTKALDALEPQLFNEARCSSDMRIKEDCILAIETLTAKRKAISDEFLSLLENGCNSFRPTNLQATQSKPAPVTSLDLSHLSLVDDDTLQERIDIQTVVAESQRSCEHLLIPIASGFARIFSVPEVDKFAHPLAPSRLGDWLQSTLHEGRFATVARSVIYQTFKEELFDTLAPLYKEIIDLFQAYSIELAMQRSKTNSYNIKTLSSHPVDLGFVSTAPEAKYRRRGLDEQVETESTGESLADEDSIPQLEEEISVGAKQSGPLNLADWLENNQVPHRVRFDEGIVSEIDASFALSEIQADDDRTLISVSAKQLNQVLAAIQLEMLRDETDWVTKLRQYLASRTNEHELWVINPQHENIMRLVNHALNLICEMFHPSVARYLNSLRVAFTRMAITDAGFLNNVMHPAKSLFDGLTYLCYGLNPMDKRIIKHLFRTVREIYEAGAGEGPGLEKIRYELLAFIEVEQHTSLTEEKATLQTLYKQQQRFLAFKTADAFIQTRYKTLAHLLTFHKLLHSALRHILAESYLNGGAGSEDWRLTTKVFYALMFATQAAATEDNKHKILSGLPKLLGKLSEFCKKHRIPLDVQSLIIKQLNEIQTLIVAGKDGSSLRDEDLSETNTIQYLLDKIKAETKESYRQKQIIGHEHSTPAPFTPNAEAKLLEPGQLVAYIVDEQILMCKYVYHFEPLDKRVFVNWEGQKLFERETHLVKQDLAKGYAKPLGLPVPIESALRYVIKQATADN